MLFLFVESTVNGGDKTNADIEQAQTHHKVGSGPPPRFTLQTKIYKIMMFPQIHV